MNPFDLTGKVAIVTGGNGGLGLGIARGLAGAGARLTIVGRDAEKSHNAAASIGPEVQVLTADLAIEADCARVIREVVDHHGRLDILVNNAGTTVRKPPQDLSLDEWRSVIDVNLTAAFLLCRAAYPALSVAGGKVVNVASINAIFGSSYASAYASSKGGLVALTRSLALAWAADNIQVNAILPGWFDTELTRRGRAEVPGLDEKVRARVPAGRWADPEELAGTAIWLASRASDFVTGASIAVDGGFSVAP